MILYDDQDTGLWDYELISKGGYFLHQASTGETLSKYHLEAAIAYWHTTKEDRKEKWEAILQLFDQLLELDYSPMAALNRIYVLSKVKGKEAALYEMKNLDATGNPFYHTLLGELYSGIDYDQAIGQFQKAYSLVQTDAEKRNLSRKMELVGR
jgi:RNA polymerase sigma-70 factor (ECF subfamily)